MIEDILNQKVMALNNNEGVEIQSTKPFNAPTNTGEWDNSDLLNLRNKFSEIEDLI